MGGKPSKQPAKTPAPAAKSAAPAPVPKKSAAPAVELSAADEAVFQLKEQQDALAKATRRADRLGAKLKEKAAAALKAGKRDDALALMRRRRAYEDQQQRLTKTLMGVEEMLNSLESAQMDRAVLAALSGGAEQLRQMQKSMGDVEAAMDSIHDAVTVAQETAALVAGEKYGELQMDDDDLLAELASLTGRTSEQTSTGSPVKATVADIGAAKVPTHQLPTEESAEPTPAVGEPPAREVPTTVAA